MTFEAYRTMCIQNDLMESATNEQYWKIYNTLARNVELDEEIKKALVIAIWTCSDTSILNITDIVEHYI